MARQDVYTEVAQRVAQRTAEDILKGPGRTDKTRAHHDVAVRLSKTVDRKLVHAPSRRPSLHPSVEASFPWVAAPGGAESAAGCRRVGTPHAAAGLWQEWRVCGSACGPRHAAAPHVRR